MSQTVGRTLNAVDVHSLDHNSPPAVSVPNRPCYFVALSCRVAVAVCRRRQVYVVLSFGPAVHCVKAPLTEWAVIVRVAVDVDSQSNRRTGNDDRNVNGNRWWDYVADLGDF